MTDAPPPFQLDLCSAHGRKVASAAQIDDCFDVREWTSWLRIRSEVSGYIPPSVAPSDDEATAFVPPVFERDGLAVLVVARSFEDLTGSAIGLFYMRLDKQALEGIRAAVEQTPWIDLPRPIGGEFTAPQIRLHYARPGFVVQREFNAASGNFIEAIGPLWQLLCRHSERVAANACATLEMSLRADPDPESPRTWRLTLTLRNLGHDPIVLTDPRVPSTDGGPPRLELRFGNEPADPLWPLVETTPIATPSLPGDAGQVVTLAHRKRLEIEIPWTPPGPGHYRVLATWRDYRGPLEAVPGQTPFMPLPPSGPPYFGSGPYPIRGALFGRVLVEVPPPDSTTC
ncbi:hypothetical protein ENSA5_32760 [Enhygromyxa salina]|uniref:Uncharacterized protein n=1 Tax=Enhygromyxa salina TaxID=215803 RepID=A0A2S9XXL0_9BACT|nr:hypothetical protein [Enhygromyxa salina]PRP97583.1 hypothetical protein ENSA5_32760 [Enhygromyxa salina]